MKAPGPKPARPKLLVDVDGVIASCSSSGPEFALGPILEGARAALFILSRHFHLLYYTARQDHSYVARYLKENGLPQCRITSVKESGLVIDDKAITFPGVWNQAFVDQVLAFRPWWSLIHQHPLSDGTVEYLEPELDPEG